MDPESLLDWTQRYSHALASLALAVCGLTFYLIVSRGIRTLVARGVMAPTMAGRLYIVLRWLVALTLVLVLLEVAGTFKNAWAVFSAALTTIAIGFVALWSVLSNMVCSFLILVFRPFRVGDEIQVLESNLECRGRVHDMNLFFVTLQTVEPDESSAQIQIPNTLFFQKMIKRWNAPGQRESFFPQATDTTTPIAKTPAQ